MTLNKTHSVPWNKKMKIFTFGAFKVEKKIQIHCLWKWIDEMCISTFYLFKIDFKKTNYWFDTNIYEFIQESKI